MKNLSLAANGGRGDHFRDALHRDLTLEREEENCRTWSHFEESMHGMKIRWKKRVATHILPRSSLFIERARQIKLVEREAGPGVPNKERSHFQELIYRQNAFKENMTVRFFSRVAFITSGNQRDASRFCPALCRSFPFHKMPNRTRDSRLDEGAPHQFSPRSNRSTGSDLIPSFED